MNAARAVPSVPTSATTVREATAAEVAGWDTLTVDVPGGEVLQSLAWARHRARTGWVAHHLVTGDSRGVLALTRPFPLVGGAQAYLPRGPVTAGDPPERVAARLGAVTEWLAGRGVDVVTTDAQVPTGAGYERCLADLDFEATDEIEPNRHRVVLPIDGRDEEALLAGVAKATRQRIRGAESEGVTVRRFDRAAEGNAGEGFQPGPTADLARALTAFHGLVAATGQRRGFELGPLGPFLAWLTDAHDAGHAIYLEARAPGAATPAAGLLLYRQGDRLSTSISGDDAAVRTAHPGLMHLLRWRAIQLAAREGRAEMDLGGVDVTGARHEPRPGEQMHGLYQHKVSFGAHFVEQVGAHRRVLRPRHFALVQAAQRLRGAAR